MDPAAKRLRANTLGDAETTRAEAPSTQTAAEKATQLVDKIDAQEVSKILIQAAQAHPDVMAMLDDSFRAMVERERARVITFDYYSSSIWREINVSYKSMRGSQQYEQAFDVASETSSTIQSIARQCGRNANPQTRYNGLSVLRKIGKTICLSGGNTIAHEVQKHFQSDDALVKGMISIINSMGDDELKSIANQEDTEKLYPKLVELDQLSEDRCLFEGIQDVPWNVGGYAADREEKGYPPLSGAPPPVRGEGEEAEQEKAEPEVIVIE
ncbi:unnamed protein product [Penicillium salamii]|uniref:Uncharacterized protein n=1 Tax=Penicillium salamii TaxID=1612424 RepID=A0A9W4ILH8_9EURO|nr:unnamed protein product [Penicillium salamii]CAG8036152.1 unnamed protein product [Penicillium salamii]CAG8058088.1 unnamed protein product [Penicillium salamii]CAG8085971.1 unnamed protein product [Penicillium salamii]CAG8094095.1 unnamed protein product [Penicillium salamii]